MVSDYFDARQERWLEDRGIGLMRGSGRVAGPGVVEVDGVPTPPFTCCRDHRANLDKPAKTAGLGEITRLLAEQERLGP